MPGHCTPAFLPAVRVLAEPRGVGRGRQLEGMLLYPTIDRELDLWFFAKDPHFTQEITDFCQYGSGGNAPPVPRTSEEALLEVSASSLLL
jgi:hypothetical protein